MSIFVDHPNDWIGVPTFGVADRWQRPEDWARELVDALADGENVSRDQRDRIENVFAMLARSVAERGASASFLRLGNWDGPLVVVDLRVESRLAAGTISVEDYAGAADPDAIDPPVIKPFVTTSGLVGVRCTRYLTPDKSVPGVVATRDYAWEVDGTLVALRTASYDLIEFERSLAQVEALAETVYSK